MYFFCFISSWRWWRFFPFCCLATPWPLDSLSHWLGECISLQLPGCGRVSNLPLRQDFISCPASTMCFSSHLAERNFGILLLAYIKRCYKECRKSLRDWCLFYWFIVLRNNTLLIKANPLITVILLLWTFPQPEDQWDFLFKTAKTRTVKTLNKQGFQLGNLKMHPLDTRPHCY